METFLLPLEGAAEKSALRLAEDMTYWAMLWEMISLEAASRFKKLKVAAKIIWWRVVIGRLGPPLFYSCKATPLSSSEDSPLSKHCE